MSLGTFRGHCTRPTCWTARFSSTVKIFKNSIWSCWYSHAVYHACSMSCWHSHSRDNHLLAFVLNCDFMSLDNIFTLILWRWKGDGKQIVMMEMMMIMMSNLWSQRMTVSLKTFWRELKFWSGSKLITQSESDNLLVLFRLNLSENRQCDWQKAVKPN